MNRDFSSIVEPNIVIIEGEQNFFIINIIKYLCLIVFISLSVVMILKMIKQERLNRTLMAVTVIFLLISFLAFFTGIYDSAMRVFLPYYYGV